MEFLTSFTSGLDPFILKIFQVGILLIVGFFGGQYAKLIKLPNVSGYLIFGILLGPSISLLVPGFDGILSKSDLSSLGFLTDIALAFIAFSIGSEFKAKSLKKVGKPILLITFLEAFLAAFFVLILIFIMPKPASIMQNGYKSIFAKENISFSLLISSLAAATAPAATLLVIRQYRAYGNLTKTVLPVTALDDIVAVIIFGISISIVGVLFPSKSQHIATWYSFVKPFIEIFASIGLGLLISYYLNLLSKLILKNRDSLQGLSVAFILFTLGLCYVLNNAFLGYLSFSPLLANIFLGAGIANISKKPHKLFDSVNDFSSPFFIIFFTLAGAHLNLNILKQNYLIFILTLVYVIARAAGKYLGAYTGCKISKLDKNVSHNLGFSLLPQGGVAIGLMSLIQKQFSNHIELEPMVETMATITMLAVLIYETSGPIFAKMAIKRSGEMYGLDRLSVLDFSE